MLADRYPGRQQLRVHRAVGVAGVVDVQRVDADQHGAGPGQVGRGIRGQERVVPEVLVGPPVPVPAGVDEHRLAPAVIRQQQAAVDGPGSLRHIHPDAVQLGQLVQRQLGQIVGVGIAMERAVQVRARVATEGDLADLESDLGLEGGADDRANRVRPDLRHRQAGIGDHPVLDHVAEIGPAQHAASGRLFRRAVTVVSRAVTVVSRDRQICVSRQVRPRWPGLVPREFLPHQPGLVPREPRAGLVPGHVPREPRAGLVLICGEPRPGPIRGAVRRPGQVLRS